MSRHAQRMAICLLVSITSLVGYATADVVILNDGDIIEGTIVEEGDDLIRVKVTSSVGITVTRTFLRDDIRSIKKGPVEPAGGDAEQGKADQAEAADDAEDEQEDEEDDGRQLPIEIDLRMALQEPLILDSFKDGRENVTPRGSGYFVLVPFQYEALEEPYTITRYRVKFSADRGSARCRGIVALEDKGSGRSTGRGARAHATPQPVRSLDLTVAKDKPLYTKMTVFAVGDELRVVTREVPRLSTDDDKSSRAKVSRRSSRSSGRSSRRSYRSSSVRGRARSLSGSRARTRDSGEELRGYQRRRYAATEEPDDQADAEDSAGLDSAGADLSTRERRLLDDSRPASGWAAFLVELANEAAVVTARMSSDEQVRIELRLIDALTRKSGRGRDEGELQLIRTLNTYAGHESPALAQLAIARLAEMRSPDKKGRGASDEPGELDERTQLIEQAMLQALTSSHKRIRRTAWWELTSSDALPTATETMILNAPAEVAEALVGRVEEEIAEAAKAPALPDDTDRVRGSARRSPPRGRDRDDSGVSYTPQGLQESAAAPGVWAVLGTLMRVNSQEVATRAVALALKDGSRQAISLLGAPSRTLASAAVQALPKLPNNQAKQEAVKMLLAGFSAGQSAETAEILSGLTAVVSGMAKAGRPLVVSSPEDVIMQAVSSLRDKPPLQLEALRLLHWCYIDLALNADGIDQWLTSMTDELVAKDCQQATVILVANKWAPKSLRPLSNPGKVEAATAPQPAAKPAAARRPPRGRSRGPAKKPGPDAEASGPIEKFLVAGLAKFADPSVQVPSVLALLRAGRAELVMAHHAETGAEPLAALLQQVAKASGQYPPIIAPGQPTRFTSIDLAMALAKAKEDPAVINASAQAVAQVVSSSLSASAWRTTLSLKRRMAWKPLASMCSAPDPQAADAIRQTLVDALGLAPGERDAIGQAPDVGAIMGKLADYDRQRAARIPGKYQAVVLCDVLMPNYRLEFDPEDDPQAKERGATIVDLTWYRQALALEPGQAEITTSDDGKIQVKLGSVVIGSGKLPKAKADETDSKKPAAASGDPQQDALQKRLAALRGAGARKGGGKDEAPPKSSFSIELPKLAQALYTSPALRGKIPLLAMAPTQLPARARRAVKGAGAELAADLMSCPMHHLAFGTRQGQAQLGDGSPPKLDNMEVRVDKNGRIVRGASVVPRVQTVQIFLEPVR